MASVDNPEQAKRAQEDGWLLFQSNQRNLRQK